MRSKYSYLRPFVGDWATKECLRDHLSGKRSYRCRNGAVEEDDSSDFGNIIIGSEPDDDDEGDEGGEGDEDGNSNGNSNGDEEIEYN